VRSYSNILVIQTAFIGDAILASSLVEKLHHALPSAKISILVRKGNEGIYKDHPYLHEVLVWNKTSQKLRNLFRLIFEIRKRKFDCVINGHRYSSSGVLTAFSGARHTAGFKENPLSFAFDFTARHRIGDGRHETERLQSLVTDFTGTEMFRPRLYPSPEAEKAVSSYVARGAYVCMAPASVWFTKQLPEEKWIGLCRKIPHDVSIFFIGAPSDYEFCNRIGSASGHPRVEILAGRLSLAEAAALISRAAMNYVNDSAPLHLASAVNAPVTAFFCSTVPRFGFGPLSDRSQVIGVDELPCRPCGLHGYRACPLRHFRCGHDMIIPEYITPHA
jgi:ADP-heptose:LPS heptosyltransferase